MTSISIKETFQAFFSSIYLNPSRKGKVESGSGQRYVFQTKCLLYKYPILDICVHASAQSHFWLSATPWAAAHQAPLSMEFSRWEYWSGLPFSPPRELRNPGIKLASLALQVDSLPLSQGACPILFISATEYEFSLQLVYDGSPELVGFSEGVMRQLQFEN